MSAEARERIIKEVIASTEVSNTKEQENPLSPELKEKAHLTAKTLANILQNPDANPQKTKALNKAIEKVSIIRGIPKEQIIAWIKDLAENPSQEKEKPKENERKEALSEKEKQQKVLEILGLKSFITYLKPNSRSTLSIVFPSLSNAF